LETGDADEEAEAKHGVLELESVDTEHKSSVWKLANIVVTYEIRVFFEGAQKEVFSSILKKSL
jgi:hypothetical protein